MTKLVRSSINRTVAGGSCVTTSGDPGTHLAIRAGGMVTGARPCSPSYSVDSRLIAAVEKFAGARCHKAASLIFSYRLFAYLSQDVARGADMVADRERRMRCLEYAETSLRQFLSDCQRMKR